MKYYLNHNFTNIGQHTFYLHSHDMKFNPITVDDFKLDDLLLKELQFRLSEELNQFRLDNNLIKE